MLMRKTKKHNDLSKKERRLAFEIVLVDLSVFIVAVVVLWFVFIIINIFFIKNIIYNFICWF